jgi:CHASE3 domain sensor protein
MNHMTFLSDALDGLGRWYVAIPPFLIISFLAALFFVTGEGQARLREAGDRLEKSAAREHSIDELQTSLAGCVAAEDAFLLTGDQRYIKTYHRVLAEIEPRLDTLRRAYAGSDSGLSAMRDLQVLTGKRLADLSMILAIQQSQGTPHRLHW